MSIRDYRPRNLEQLRRRFPGDDACYAELFRLRSSTPFRCQCGSQHWRQMTRPGDRGHADRAFRVCVECGWQESATAGTVLHGTRVPLRDWFLVFWWAAGTEDGISARKLCGAQAKSMSIYLGSQRTVFRCIAVLRRIMTFRPKLIGDVRVGTAPYRSAGAGRGGVERFIAMAMIEQPSSTRLAVLADDSAASIRGFTDRFVDPASRICATDPRLSRLETRIRVWLHAVGPEALDRRNIDAYLGEFAYRHDRTHRGVTVSRRFASLLRDALSTPAEIPEGSVGPKDESSPDQPSVAKRCPTGSEEVAPATSAGSTHAKTFFQSENHSSAVAREINERDK